MATLQDLFDAWNTSGRLKASVKPEAVPAVTGTANAVNGAVVANVANVSNVTIHTKNTGTATLNAGTWVFEASVDSTNGTDGTWFGIQAAQTNSNTVVTSVSPTGVAAAAGNPYAWEASVNGYNWVRVRCTVAITASASAQWTIVSGAYATEPCPAAQVTGTQPVSGWVTVTPITPTPYTFESTAAVLLANVKNSAGRLYGLVVSNVTASACYVKLYNKASAPVAATDTPIATFPIPANSTGVWEFGALGLQFATGISIGASGAAAKTDATALAAGVQIAAAYM